MNHNFIEIVGDDYDLFAESGIIYLYNQNGWSDDLFKCTNCNLIKVETTFRGFTSKHYHINNTEMPPLWELLTCDEIIIKSIIE